MTQIIQIFCALGFFITLGILSFLVLAPPGTDLGIFAKGPDPRLGHFFAFFFMTPLAVGGFPQFRLYWIILGLILLGVALELSQSFTGREVSLADIAANLSGIAAGVYPLIALRFRDRLQARMRQKAGTR